jgi:hypothetical protein
MTSPGASSSLGDQLPGITHTVIRIFVYFGCLVAITIVLLLLQATHHGAHANSPTHCGFWNEIGAGLSCR